MSLLISDSISDIVDIGSLSDDVGVDLIGKIEIGNRSYIIDGFISDKKSFRVQAQGSTEDAISTLNLRIGETVKITLGDEAFSATGQLTQVGYEFLPRGGRVIFSMIVRDK